MSGIVPSIVDPSSKAPESTSLVARGEAFVVVQTAEEYAAAGAWLVGARSWVTALWDHFGPSLKAQYDAWKAGRAAVSAITDPVTLKADAVERALQVWRDKQEAERQAETRRLEAEQRQRESDERAAAALMAEEDGDAVQAEAIREAPSTAAPVHIPRGAYVPAVSGLGTRKKWKAKVTDRVKLAAAIGRGDVPVDAMMGLELDKDTDLIRSTFLDGRAAEWKSLLSQKYPGVEAYEHESTTTAKR